MLAASPPGRAGLMENVLEGGRTALAYREVG